MNAKIQIDYSGFYTPSTLHLSRYWDLDLEFNFKPRFRKVPVLIEHLLDLKQPNPKFGFRFYFKHLSLKSNRLGLQLLEKQPIRKLVAVFLKTVNQFIYLTIVGPTVHSN